MQADSIRIGVIDKGFESVVNPCGFSNFQPRPKCQQPGPAAEIVFFGLTPFNISFQQIAFSKTISTDFVNQSWTGLLGSIQNGTVHTFADLWLQTEFIQNSFDFSFPVAQCKPVFISKTMHPTLATSALLPFKVFDVYLWLGLFCIAMIIRSTLFVARKMGRNGFIQAYSRVKTLFTIFAFTVILFGTLYRGRLLIELLKQTNPKLFRDSYHLIELIKQKQITLVVVNRYDWFYTSILHSPRVYYQLLKDAIHENPVVFENDFDNLHDMISTGKYVTAQSSCSAHLFLSSTCDLEAVEGDALPNYRMGFLFKKNSPWLPKFNLGLIYTQRHTESILGTYWYSKVRNCQISENRLGTQPLTMTQLSGVFGLLMATIVFAMFIFITEILVQKGMRRLDRKYSTAIIESKEEEDDPERKLRKLMDRMGSKLTKLSQTSDMDTVKIELENLRESWSDILRIVS